MSRTPVVVPREIRSFDNTTVVAVPPTGTGPGTTNSTINVSGLAEGLPMSSVKVSLHIVHTGVSDLTVTIISPTGVSVELSSENGDAGFDNGYGAGCLPTQRTSFDDIASTPISAVGAAPSFVGVFQPEQPLSRFRGHTPNGTWTLRIDDNYAAASGTLYCWTLEIQTGLLPKMIALARSSNTLLRFDSAAPGTIQSSVPITGLVDGDIMRAIDFRPANDGLYGIGSNENGDQLRLYTLNPATGAASPFPTLITGLTRGEYWGMTFDPVLDQIRVVNDFQENLRINPNDGSRADVPTNDVSVNGVIDSLAYSPSGVLHTLNVATSSLARIEGVTSATGGQVIDIGPVGFQFYAYSSGLDTAWDGSLFGATTDVATSVTGLYLLNTVTGGATPLGTIGDGTQEIDSLAVVLPLTDVQVTIADSPDPLLVGGSQSLTYSVTVTNQGAEPAIGVDLTVFLPADASFVSLTAPPGWNVFAPPVGIEGAVVTANRFVLAAGAIATFTLVAQLDASAPVGSLLEAFANVFSNFDSQGSNDFAASQTAVSATPTPSDQDGDTLPDAWELQFGLSSSSAIYPNGPLDDPDADGISNADELIAGTHPRGFVTRYFAEGATSDFFDTSIAILNTSSSSSAKTLLRHLRADETTVSQFVDVPVLTRRTVDPEIVFGAVPTEFGTVIEADTVIVADRTLRWDGNSYGSHAERSLGGPETTWYLAEGATHSGFNLFYLIQNANPSATSVQVTYLLPAPSPPIVQNYVVGPNSRFNIWVNREGPALASTDVSAIVTASQPVIVERAMYLNSGGQLFGAGHESAGVTAPALSWFLAEGATGDFFDLFVLIANPNPTDSAITATYLLPDGSTVVKNYVASANSRFNIWVDLEDPLLAATAVSTTIASTNGVPVIVERAMWWPGSSATWFEAHNSAGSTSTGTRWGLAEGEQGGPFSHETYILIANTSATAGSADVTLYFEDSTSVTRTFPLNPNSRFNVAVSIDFPEAISRRFGAVVQSTGSPAAQIIVERAVYSNAFGVVWAAGSNALGTPY